MAHISCGCIQWKAGFKHGFVKVDSRLDGETCKDRIVPMIVGLKGDREIRYCPWCGKDLTNKCRQCKNYHIYGIFKKDILYHNRKCEFDAKYGDKCCKFELSEVWKE